MKALVIAIKDLSRSMRSLFGLGMMFAVPLLITGLMYFAFGGLVGQGGQPALQDFRVLVVNLDRPAGDSPALGDAVLTFLQDERMPDWLIADGAADEPSAQAAVDHQEAGAYVLIPADFTARLMAQETAIPLQIVHDPTLTIGPQVLASILQQFADGVSGTGVALNVARSTLEQTGQAMQPEQIGWVAQAYTEWYQAAQRDLNHAAEPALAFRSVGSGQVTQATGSEVSQLLGQVMAGMMIMFVYFGASLAAQSILTESEEGTLARLFTTPTGRSTILAGKFLYVLTLVVGQSIVLLLASRFLFGIDWGRPATVILLLLGLCLSAAGFGVFLVSLCKNSRQAGLVIGGALSATGMLGGLFTAAVQMPEGFKRVNKFLPQGWLMEGFQQSLSGAQAQAVMVSVAICVAAGAVLFLLGSQIFNRRFA
jgi:ABC-2 type transport system permease protein